MKNGMWWFATFMSILNALIVFTNIVTYHVNWITWLNGFAAVVLALRAGSYPIEQESKE